MPTSPAHRCTRIALVLISLAACEAQADPDYSGEPLATLRGAVSGDAPTQPAVVGALWFQSTPEYECAGPVVSCSVSTVGGGGDGLPDIWCIDDCHDAHDSCDEENVDTLVTCLSGCGYEAEQVTATPTWSLCASGAVSETVPVTGSFPAQFTLELFAPPPAAALLQSSPTAPRGALALIVAQPADADPVELVFDSDDTWDLLGGAETQLLFYAADPIPADSDWGQLVGGAVGVGYHVLEVVPPETVCTPIGDDGEEVCSSGQFTLRPSPDGIDAEIDLRLAPLFDLDLPLPNA